MGDEETSSKKTWKEISEFNTLLNIPGWTSESVSFLLLFRRRLGRHLACQFGRNSFFFEAVIGSRVCMVLTEDAGVAALKASVEG